MKTAYALLIAASLPLVACAGADSSDGQEDDVTAGRPKATLLTETFKKTVRGPVDTKCVFNVTYARALAPAGSPSSPTVVIGKFLNAALYYGEQNPENRCDESMTVTGGFKEAAVNEGYVLSVLYRFEASYDGMPGEFIKPINLNLSTGKPIALSDLLTAAGKQKLIARCDAQFKAELEAQDASSPRLEGVCKNAVTMTDTQKTEDFTITKAGIRVHVDRHLDHADSPLAGEGFLVKWSELGTGLKAASPVKALAGR